MQTCQKYSYLLVRPSSSSGQGGPTGRKGLAHVENALADVDNPHVYKNTYYVVYRLFRGLKATRLVGLTLNGFNLTP